MHNIYILRYNNNVQHDFEINVPLTALVDNNEAKLTYYSVVVSKVRDYNNEAFCPSDSLIVIWKSFNQHNVDN